MNPAAMTSTRQAGTSPTAIDRARLLIAELLDNGAGSDPAGIGADDTLSGLGLDSLDRVALAVAIERATGADLADTAVLRIQTVTDLAGHLAGGQA
jgi:acyl carrier protein